MSYSSHCHASLVLMLSDWRRSSSEVLPVTEEDASAESAEVAEAGFIVFGWRKKYWCAKVIAAEMGGS